MVGGGEQGDGRTDGCLVAVLLIVLSTNKIYLDCRMSIRARTPQMNKPLLVTRQVHWYLTIANTGIEASLARCRIRRSRVTTVKSAASKDSGLNTAACLSSVSVSLGFLLSRKARPTERTAATRKKIQEVKFRYVALESLTFFPIQKRVRRISE